VSTSGAFTGAEADRPQDALGFIVSGLCGEVPRPTSVLRSGTGEGECPGRAHRLLALCELPRGPDRSCANKDSPFFPLRPSKIR